MAKITLGQMNIGDQGKAYVNDALDTNRISSGKYTARFETTFASLHACNYGVFCNSGTSALQIALAALKEFYGYHEDDEVLVPATTFIATSNIVLQNRLKPIFVDVNPVTFNVDTSKIAEKITRKTRAILPVHLFGLPADMLAIRQIAKEHALQVLEDSCETMFADSNGYSVGSLGDIACFSTYVAHIIAGGVGGIVTTNNPKLAEFCRSLMAHGRDSIYTNIDQDDAIAQSMIDRRYRFERIGYSYRCTELEAALSLAELERAPQNIAIRRKNAAYLTELLRDLPLQLPSIPEGFTHSFMMYPIVLDIDVRRDNFLLYLEEHNIETRYLFPLLSQPIYQKLFPGLDNEYPVSQHLGQHGFFIGMHQGLTSADIEYVSETIHEYFRIHCSSHNL